MRSREYPTVYLVMGLSIEAKGIFLGINFGNLFFVYIFLYTNGIPREELLFC